MRFKRRGTTISFRYPQSNTEKFCDIFATYKENKNSRGKYDLEIKLSKIVKAGGQEFKFEHIVGQEPITASPDNVEHRISLIIDYAINNGKFDSHFSEFQREIKSSLYI